ncbi:MAG: DUF4468 domain-containing protein [Candidatus Pedobacter colombiensis]|uniref:DUF4468 domain-containing protein n=1 Tax=Candidatus Pedobacter colombiensis TaxID=3121371 RepID=A0AAJ6B8M9_9SPHI|nr:DUF4468 domain-containing protein [Pedobacter sp.]WEK20671.1 MAG: DUF4468 domain-containing protein [Pedobacter sp.]
MKTSKLTLLLILVGLLSSLNLLAQDAITWTTQRNGAKVADTVALEDYLPVKDNIVYVEAVVDLPGTTKQELFSRAKLAIQKIFTSNKMDNSNYDAESGICSVNNFYDISDKTAISRVIDKYYFNALLTVIVKDGKYKIKMEIPEYAYGFESDYKRHTDFQSESMPISNLANKRQNGKRQRMRVLKTLNDKMFVTLNLVKTGMEKKLDNDF